jgi:hypothetical protein
MFIPDQDLDFLPIPDSGVKKAPDNHHHLMGTKTVDSGPVHLENTLQDEPLVDHTGLQLTP